MPPPNCKPKVVASSKDADDIKQVASLINWHDYDRLMGRIFYEKFGRVLEEKLAEFENRKQQLKDCIRRNLGANNMATPKRPIRNAAVLTQQICDLKKLAINSSESESEDADEGSSTSDMDTVNKSEIAENEVTKEENMGVDVIEPIIRHVAQKEPQQVDDNRDKLLKFEHQQPIIKAVGNKNEPSSDAFVQDEIQKELKLNALRKKAADANLQREAFLRDKAERIRREREERARKVEEKKIAEEQKKKERDQQLLEHQERVRFFAAQQKLPFHTALGKQTTPATKKTPARTKRQPNQAKIASVKTASIMNGNDVDNQENVTFVPQTPTPPMAQPKLIGSITEVITLTAANSSPVATKKLPLLIASSNNSVNTDLSAAGSGNATYNIQKHSTNARGNLFPTDPSVGTSQSRSTATQQQPKKKPAADVHVSQVMTSTPKPNAPPINPDNEIEMTPLPRIINSSVSPCDETYNITKEKVPLPSTEDDYNINDLSSADETDDDQRPRKTVPSWAQKEGMAKYSAVLIRELPVKRIEHYFGPIQQPVLDKFFKSMRKQTVRKSSAIWTSPLSDPTPGEGKFDRLIDNNAKH